MKTLATAAALGLFLVPALASAQVMQNGPAQEQAPEQIDVAKLSKVPKQKTFAPAEYPKEAEAQGIEADVVLVLDIDATGKVTSVGIAEPAQPAGLGFDEAALIVASSWEFEPAEVDGKPIAVQLTYKYKFTLKAKTAPVETPVAPVPGGPAVPGATAPATTTPAAPAKAPQINFAGRLVERGTRLPLAGVIVTIFRDDGPTPIGFEATTKEDGGFEFFDLPVGPWKILVEAPGYYPYRTTEDISDKERIDATYHVERGSYNPYDVTVTAERPRKEVSRTVISAEEIDKVPGGAGDPLSVVQNFAGVARADFGGQLIIRGSAPEDSRIFVDGTELPLIYHFGGLKSIIPVGVLDSLEFYPGNFSPMYGRATGGIIDVRIKELKPKKVGGYADVSILDTGVYLEAPLGNKGGIAVAGRRSYIDVILKAAIPDDGGVTLTTAPRYYDFQLMANYRPTPAHDFRFFGIGSDDRLALLFENPADLDPTFEGNSFSGITTFYRAMGAYLYRPGGPVENTLRVAVGQDHMTFGGGQLRFELDIFDVSVRDNVHYKWSDKWAMNAGVDLQIGVADVFVRLPQIPQEGQPMSNQDLGELITTESNGEVFVSPATFVEGELSPVPGLLLLPGVRFDYLAGIDEAIVQPRLTARWQVTPQVVAKGGAGLFVQAPLYPEFDKNFGNPALAAEKAWHYSLGTEVKALPYLTLDATAFYKDMQSLVSATDELVMGEGGETRPLIYNNGGEGHVYGLELQARHTFAHNLTGWLAYTLSRAERRDQGAAEERLFDFDQTHILTVVASYQLPRNWLVGGRFRLVSGNPNTPVIDAIYDAAADRYDPVYGGVNTGRDEVFHQLDVRVDKRWIYRTWMLNAYLDIQNVYNRANAEGVAYNFDYSQQRPQTGIPILTIVGLRAEF